MIWILNGGILICAFCFAKALLLKIDDALAEQSATHKYLAVIASVYLFSVAGLLHSAWEGIFWVSLALAAYSDYVTKEIYDFVYFPAGVICVYQVLSEGNVEKILGLTVFCCIQMVIFKRLYGVSDCIAFSVCAMYVAAHGGGMQDYWLHMFIAFLLFLIVQAFKRNIDKKGRLKKPGAFIPYIAAAMLYMQVCIMWR